MPNAFLRTKLWLPRGTGKKLATPIGVIEIMEYALFT